MLIFNHSTLLGPWKNTFMRFYLLRFCGTVTRLSRTSHHHHVLSSLDPSLLLLTSPFSTLEERISLDPSSSRNQVCFDESKVLNELSELLPISYRRTPACNLYIPDDGPKCQLQEGGATGHIFLPPEDKLGGVFLQKLPGKAAVENALNSASINLDVTVDLVAKVVDRGDLGGEAMVLFFNWAIKQPSISAGLGTYHVMLKALGRKKLFDLMLQIVQDMYARGISPTCDTLVILTESLVKARRISKAVEIFWKLKDLGMKFDCNSFNVLLQCLSQRSHVGISHVGSANSLLNSIKGKIEFDTMTYNIIIGGWSRLGRLSEMEKSLKAMIDNGFTPDTLTYSFLIEGFGKAGMVDDALRVFEGMQDQGCLPDTRVFKALMSNYISVRNYGECLKCYETMLNQYNCMPDLDIYNLLIGALLKARKVADALEMFNEMLNRGIIPTTGTVTCFIKFLCSYGPPHAAMMIYKGAIKVGCRISLSAYKLLLERLSRFGKCGMLLELWHELQENGRASDVEVYECVVNGLCNNGQLDSAVLVMEEALQNGFCPNRLICSKLNHKLMASNKIKEAYKLFLKIKGAREKENARSYWRSNGWHF